LNSNAALAGRDHQRLVIFDRHSSRVGGELNVASYGVQANGDRSDSVGGRRAADDGRRAEAGCADAYA